jgi:hypothetical protein
LDDTVISVLQIYPNPFSAEVNIVSAGAGIGAEISLQIFNLTGALVHTEIINRASTTLQLEHLPAGVYFFRFEQDGAVRTERMIKR